MKIPFLSFHNMNADVKSELLNSFESFVDEGWYILGNRVETFENAYAKYCETKFSIGVANGLDAIIIALKALGIGPGDEVIVPSNTYIATWLAVSSVGAMPIPVEPHLDTYNINPARIEAAITGKTRAIIPVHLYGQCCEMDEIMRMAAKHQLYVIEDNAQAQGATQNNKITGSFGHINATSFYPGKNLGAYGDAGAITTDSEALNHQAKTIRNYGSNKKYYNEVLGMNSRLDELQAGLLSIKLTHLTKWNTERNVIANWYQNNILPHQAITLPVLANNCTSVYHLYVVRTEQRNELQQYLNKQGIGTLIHYPLPPHLQQAYSSLGYKKGDFPIAEEIANTCLSLPIYPGLTQEEVLYICKHINQFFNA